MTPFAAGTLLGCCIGLVTALFIAAILLLVHGGRAARTYDLHDEDRRRAERIKPHGGRW